MTNQIQNPNAKKFDLEDRTTVFAENVIDFVKKIDNNSVNRPLISQLVRAASSVAANYMEADSAESKKDFRHKIAICRKESKETRLWLRLMAKANPQYKEEIKILWKEAHELLLIFSTIFKK